MKIRNDRIKGLSYAEIGRKYSIDQRTAKRYAESLEPPNYKLKQPKPSLMDPFKQQVNLLLEEAPYSAVRILEKISEQGFKGSYTIVKQYVRSVKHELENKATVRFETLPGVQGQVDWGFFENYIVEIKGQQKKLYCFLMILGYSRMRYIEFVTDMSTTTLIRCHINAFRYFGGYPEEILYDNMKQVVVKRLLRQSDSEMNKQFEDFAGFCGFIPVLCRPYRGQTKGKVERTVRFVRDNFMTGIAFESLNDLNAQAYAWCGKVNSKPHSTTGEIPFDRLKKENLSPLTREYIIDRVKTRKVSKDCMLAYEGNYYSVPAKYALKDVIAVKMNNSLAVYCDKNLVAMHTLSLEKNRMVLEPAHYASLTGGHGFEKSNVIFSSKPCFSEPVQSHDLLSYDEVM
ncbi:MAG: IS21 family transposase [Eubacteriales bacterium]|nr:IS21 family transposase [Eubacteriales bacterium]